MADIFRNRYDDTIIATDSSTYRVPNATSVYGFYHFSESAYRTFPGLPTSILAGTGEYGGTSIAPATTRSISNQEVVYSPSAWVNLFSSPLLFFAWTRFDDGVSITHSIVNAWSVNVTTELWDMATEPHPTEYATTFPQVWSSGLLGTQTVSSADDLPLTSCDFFMSGAPTGKQYCTILIGLAY